MIFNIDKKRYFLPKSVNIRGVLLSILYKIVRNGVKAYQICEKCHKEIDDELDGVFMFTFGRVKDGVFHNGKEILYFHSHCLVNSN